MLVLLPLVSQASAWLTISPVTPAAASEMPCHDITESATNDAAVVADCPHCLGDAPFSQCQCCDFAVPAAIPSLFIQVESVNDGCSRYVAMVSDATPDSPGERLYRPPITPR